MSIHVTSLIWKASFPATQKLVLLKMADCANDDGTYIYPAVDRIAQECGLSVRTIQYTLRNLTTQGDISLTGSEHGGRGHIREYKINVQTILQKIFAQKKGANDGLKGANDGLKGANDGLKGANDGLKGATVAPFENQDILDSGDEKYEANQPVTDEKTVLERKLLRARARTHSPNLKFRYINKYINSPKENTKERGVWGENHTFVGLCEKSEPSENQGKKLSVDMAVDLWNSLAEKIGLAKVQMVTATRRKSIEARLREVGLQGWNEALGKVETNPFFAGQNDRGWKANFDFFIRQSSFTKLIEGGYEASPGIGNGQRNRNQYHGGDPRDRDDETGNLARMLSAASEILAESESQTARVEHEPRHDGMDATDEHYEAGIENRPGRD